MSLDIYLQADCGNDNFVEAYTRNITHNCSGMFNLACGESFYDVLEQATYAIELVPVLKKMMYNMKVDPQEYTRLNPPNGWGDANAALDFVEDLLYHCKKYPITKVGIWI